MDPACIARMEVDQPCSSGCKLGDETQNLQVLKSEVLSKLGLETLGKQKLSVFSKKDGLPLCTEINRIVTNDHRPYVELLLSQIKNLTISKGVLGKK